MTTGNSHLGGCPYAFDANDSRRALNIEGIGDVDKRAVSEQSLKNSADSKPTELFKQERGHEPYQSSVPLVGVGAEEDDSILRASVGALTIDDVSPIEAARARFLEFVVDYFTIRRYVLASDCEADYTAQYEQDNARKRKPREITYKGNSQYVCPLKYVVNIYETLVNEVNARLASVDGFQGMTIEVAGGLNKRLAQKFPEEGPIITFERRELTTPGDTRRWFPEMVVQEEKEVLFVVVDGLDIVEKPETVPVADAEWFKRLTGRSEVSISAQDYAFYSPRHKNWHVGSNSLPSISGLPPHAGTQNNSPMASPHVLSSRPENKKLCSSKGNSSPKTPHAQPPFGSSLPRTLGKSRGSSTTPSGSDNSVTSKADVKPPNSCERPRKPYEEDPYSRELPNFMVPYITDHYEDVASRNCGFQAIAEEVGLGDEGGWRGVRRDLFLELSSLPDFYAPVFTCDSVEKILKKLAFWATPVSPPEHRFSIQDMGHIVATMYTAVFVVLGQKCVTFLPLYLKLGDLSDISEHCIVYLRHQEGFLSVTIDEGFPLPPIHPSWTRHHHSSVDGLDRRYADRLRKYEWFQSFMGPPPSL